MNIYREREGERCMCICVFMYICVYTHIHQHDYHFLHVASMDLHAPSSKPIARALESG